MPGMRQLMYLPVDFAQTLTHIAHRPLNNSHNSQAMGLPEPENHLSLRLVQLKIALQTGSQFVEGMVRFNNVL